MKKDYIYSNQLSLFLERECIGYGNNVFYIKEIERDLANKVIKENHYSKKYFNNSYIHLGLFENDTLKGVLQYGHLMNNNSVSTIVEGTKNGEALELNRMWLSDDIKIKYPESQAISMSIKYIKKKFPLIKWIQSFADERCGGFGIVYQACSFNYYGEHLSTFYTDGESFFHNIQVTASRDKAGIQVVDKSSLTKMQLRQFRYIKFIKNNLEKKCTLKKQKYPKHYLK